MNLLDQQQKFIQDEKNNNIKELCRNTIKELHQYINKQFEKFEQDKTSLRMENGKYHLEAMKQIKDTKVELDLFHKEKEKFYEEFKIINTKQEEDLKIINNSFAEFRKSVKCFHEIEEDIKVNFFFD